MVTRIPRSIVFFFLNLLTLISPAQSGYIWYHCDDNGGNYTANSTYQRNLDSVVSSLDSATNTTTYGFFSRSAGQTPDNIVNAIALCRGDMELDACRRCINDSLVRVREECPYQKGASVWYDECMLRYSNQTILGNLNTNGAFFWTVNNIPNAEELYQAMRPLMDRLRTEAAGGDSLRKFASGNTSGPGFMTIYALMQCTPDLSEMDCYNCLEAATMAIPRCCNASLDVRILYPSCNLRYSNSRFYNATLVLSPPPTESLPPLPPPPSPPPSRTPSPPSPSTPSPPPPGKSSNMIIRVITVVVILVLVLVLVWVWIFVRRKRKLEGRPSENIVYKNGDVGESSTIQSLQYSFASIKAATNDFSENNRLGQGGFGPVYKGKLQNEKQIAVKRLMSGDSGQGEPEFKNEVSLLSKLKHKNLVQLLGFSLKGSERLLMYEFVENASLDKFIFDDTKRATLDWEIRYKIIVGVARGLRYLHEESTLKIIHRDMKAGNVLLDAKMNPKIADFGMARLFTDEETRVYTSRVVGTIGYMAPEYISLGEVTTKIDVFSFGVLILEILTDRRRDSFGEAWKSWRDGITSNLIDPTLIRDGSDYLCSQRDMIRCIQIGILCIRENAADRPTMDSVVSMLGSSSQTLPFVPLQPDVTSQADVPSQASFSVHANTH